MSATTEMADEARAESPVSSGRRGANGRRTPAVERSLDILELFSDGRETVTAAMVVDELGLPRTSAHEMLNTLADRGYLERHDHVGAGVAFRLGLRLFQLGMLYSSRLDLVEVGKAVARDVSRQSEETVHLAVLDGTHVMYVAKVDSPHAVRMVSAEGARLPAHCTAVGKVLLAHLGDAVVRRRSEEQGGLPPMTRHSVTDIDELLDELTQVRANSVAIEVCESNVDVCCVAAPVYDASREVVAGLSVSVPLQRWDEGRRSTLSRLVHDGARDLSTRLGGITADPARRSCAAATARGC